MSDNVDGVSDNAPQLCRNPDCNNEKLYMGVEKRNGAVITEAGHKWSNTEYYQLTGIREYAPYMYGGGCVSGTSLRLEVVVSQGLS